MKLTEDEFFKNLISKSRLKMPSPDFEDQVMMHIKMEDVIQRQPVSWLIKLSWVFLILIIVLGEVTLPLLSQMQTHYFGVSSGIMKIVFELVFAVFVLLQLDSLLRYTFKPHHGTHLINQLRES